MWPGSYVGQQKAGCLDLEWFSAADGKICTGSLFFSPGDNRRKLQHNALGKTCHSSMCADSKIKQCLGKQREITQQIAKKVEIITVSSTGPLVLSLPPHHNESHTLILEWQKAGC